MWRHYQRKLNANAALRRAVLHPLAAAAPFAVGLPVAAAITGGDAKPAAVAAAATAAPAPAPPAPAAAKVPVPATAPVAAPAAPVQAAPAPVVAAAAAAKPSPAPAASPALAAATGVTAAATAAAAAHGDDPDTPAALVYLRTLPRMFPRLFQAYARPMAYASEVGESLRNVAPKLVRPMYALSWLYVVADTGLQTYQYAANLNDALTDQKAAAAAAGAALATAKPSAIAAAGKSLTAAGTGAGGGSAAAAAAADLSNRWERLAYKFGDTFAWHSIASMLLPALTVNRTVHLTTALATRYAGAYPAVARYAPAAVALCLIPFVIHPIDHATDWVFDRTLRKWYAHKIALPGDRHKAQHGDAHSATAAAPAKL